MSIDPKAIMLRDERRRQMLNDPDLTGDLLLFALCLDEVIATRREQGRKSLRNWVQEVAILAHGDGPYYMRYWGKNVIGQDIPTHEADGFRSPSVPCVAPMIRREGQCGKKSSVRFIDHDPKTGEGKFVGLCARHRWHMAYFNERQREWEANGEPVPPANRGGVLRRYFSTDWEGIYRWARPGVKPMEGGREATPPRPKLRLIQGGSEDSEVES